MQSLRRVLVFACMSSTLPIVAHAVDGAGAISLTIPPDTRSAAMGGAFTAIAEGTAAIWWNPAALSFERGISLRPLTHYELVPDLADDVWYRSFAFSGGYSAFGGGIQYSRLNYGTSDAVDVDGNVFATFESYEKTLHVAAGVNLLELFAPTRATTRNLSWGIGTSFKRAHVDLAPEQVIPSVFGSGSGDATAWDFDLGTLVVARMPLTEHSGGNSFIGGRLGVQFTSIFGRELEFIDAEQSDPLPQDSRIGLAFEAMFNEPEQSVWARMLVAYDFEQSLVATSVQPIHHVGFETTLGLDFGEAAIFLIPRYGYINDLDGDVRDHTFGGGVGGHIVVDSVTMGIRFDYASVPQASDLARRNNNFTFSGWVGL